MRVCVICVIQTYGAEVGGKKEKKRTEFEKWVLGAANGKRKRMRGSVTNAFRAAARLKRSLQLYEMLPAQGNNYPEKCRKVHLIADVPE